MSDEFLKGLMERAVAAAQREIPSEEITYTEMMENLAHASGQKMILWPDQCPTPKLCGDLGECHDPRCVHTKNEFSKKMMQATNPRKHWRA